MPGILPKQEHYKTANLLIMYKLLTTLTLCLLICSTIAQAQKKTMPTTYTTDWKRIDSLAANGLYRSALEQVERVYQRAKAEANYPQVVKAAMQRGVYQSFLDQNAYPKLVKSLQTDIEQSPEPVRSVLYSVLAEVYWQYYQQNRWQVMNRAQVNKKTAVNDSIQTWDAQRFVSETTDAYLESLQNATLLKQTTVAAFDPVIAPADAASTTLQPTLFDLVAHRAITFFRNTEADMQRPTFRFELDQVAYFGGPEAFARLNLSSKDSLSGRFLALKIYQQLLAFHLRDTDTRALADVDVQRLAFVHQHSVVPDKDKRYRQTLEAEAARRRGQVSEADYLYALAEFLGKERNEYRPLQGNEGNNPDSNAYKWDKKQAADLCRDLIKRYPETVPGRNAQLLLNRLTESSLGVQLEEINEPQKPFRALVTYRNVRMVYFRLVRLTFREAGDEKWNGDKTVKQKWLGQLMRRPSLANGQFTLPDDGDLHQHTTEIPLPALPLGHYALLISDEEKFPAEAKHLVYSSVTVSQLGVLTKGELYGVANQQFYVVNRSTGEPQKNIDIQLLRQNQSANTLGDEGWRTISKTQQGINRTTDGLIIVDTRSLPDGNYTVRVVSGADTIKTSSFYVSSYRQRLREQPEQVTRQFRLFTDRSIYRPGQPIYFKGLLFEGKENTFNVVPNEKLEVTFLDGNGETVSKITLATNEYGTVNGSFTAPVGRLTGVMSIGNDLGRASIRVEEYKRPTFEVVAQPIKGTYRLTQLVSVSAIAKTFSGAVVDGASVRYRVTRQQRVPWWAWGWWRPVRPSQAAEIASGTLATDTQGVVSLTFVAEPDRSVARTDNPIFDFVVTFDVTDRNGETRSTTQTVRVGYTGLELSLPITGEVDNRTGQPVTVKVTNTAGEPVAVQTELTIYRLQAPARKLRKRLWTRPDRPIISRAEHERLFPADVFEAENELTNWPKADVARLANPKSVTLGQGYVPGEYLAELTATDPKTGDKATQKVFFSVMNPEQPTPPAQPDAFVRSSKKAVKTGENAVFWVGNGLPGWVLMTVNVRGKAVRNEWIAVGEQPRRVEVLVDERYLTSSSRSFAVHFTMAQQGRFYSNQQAVTIELASKQLTIETLTMRDKLKPGQAEEWTLRISGPDKERVAAEMVATLYDASLDVFDKLDWPTTIYANNDVGYGPDWGGYGFGVESGMAPFYKYIDWGRPIERHYPRLSWGDFQFTGNAQRPFYSIVSEQLFITVNKNKTGITGKAYLFDKTPVQGVTLMWKGTKKGTATNAKGQFSLSGGTQTDVLIVSYVGFKIKEITLTKNDQQIRLDPAQQVLSEVVVSYGREVKMMRSEAEAPMVMAAPMARKAVVADDARGSTETTGGREERSRQQSAPAINPRKNFSETAFFFPVLQTDKEGRVLLKFTMPEALTRWRLLTFAHTKDLKTGTLEREVVTQKELMITANAPRFFREGDTLRLSARLNNLTDKTLSGNARLDLTNALTGEIITQTLLNNHASTQSPNRSMTINGQQSTALTWTLVVPTGIEAITYRLTAQSGEFTDGEEQTVPVLPNRTLVTETLPFWVNGSETRTFTLKALTNPTPELPVQHERLTVEVTANPVWYALQNLPYLIEYPYECAEQLFSRLYANSLGAHILNQQPAFRQVVNSWQSAPPKNPLEANAELKALMLENTPWQATSRNQREQQAKLAQFFEQSRLTDEQRRAIDKLAQLQAPEGGFRWFGGMSPDLTMTLHLLSGFGHLRKLGVTFPNEIQQQLDQMLPKAVQYVDQEVGRQQAESARRGWLGYSALHYLYARSFYPQQSVPADLWKAFQPEIAKNWLNDGLQAQAMAAMALNRLGDNATAGKILASLRERATTSDEMGMYWAENRSGVRWYQAPIETQAMLIEAFAELNADKTTLDNLRRWLLRQKQTQAWSSTKATTEAIYALLLQGSSWTNPKSTVDVQVGNVSLASRATKTEVVTGYQKATFSAGEIQPTMGRVEIKKKGDGPAYGALYWQYFKPLDQVAAGSAGLSVQKTLYVQQDTPAGPVITPVSATSGLKPGDLIKVRLVLATDRDMEYVHLKDGRASGFEPMTVLSGYKYQNGLGYYEAPRDASTDFFIGYLPKGTHVFEYDLRVFQAGDFSTGIATVQCFYAPEFSAHSAGGRIKVK